MTNPLRAGCVAFMILSGLPAAASAQDVPGAGLAVTSTSAVGLLWQVSDRIALRPEFGFTSSKSTLEAVGAEQTQRTLSPGFSVLFYTRSRSEDFRPFVAPRYVYGRSHGKSTSTMAPGVVESTLVTHSASVTGGAEYVPHRRFGIFGELGIAYSRAEPANTVTQSWSIRSVVGAILYF
jgi:hypothetical protein